MKYNCLEVWFEEQVAHVQLNTPENQNHLDAEMAQELLSAARELMEKDDIKVILLGGRGSDFSCGVFPGENAGELEYDGYETINLVSTAIEEWARLPYPIIAVLHGQCRSLGLSLACIADLRYAANDTVFSVPEANWGLVPAGGITQRLPRLIGKGPAMTVLLGGESVQADRAFELGLANRLSNENDVWTEACREGRRLANMSTLSTQFTKETLLKGSEMPFDQALRLELDIYMLLQTSGDRMEGINAFLEKRTPQFKGN